jgi:hypothetical protein
MSASIRPTFEPAWARATARLTETVDLPTPPFPDEIATILPSRGSRGRAAAGRAVGHAGGTDRVGDVDADLLALHPLDRLHRGAGLAHQGGRVLGGEEEGEGDLPVGGHRQVANHPGGEEIGLEAGVPDSGERGGDAGLERLGH